MTPHSILILYIVFSTAEFLFESLLTVLNIRSVKRNSGTVPILFREHIDSEQYARSASYTLTNNRFSLVSSLFSWGVLLVIALSGFLGTVDRWIEGIAAHPYVRGLVYILAIALLFRIVSLPFSLYSQFVIEERFGFNKMTLSLFFIDAVKGLAVSLVISIPLVLIIFWFMDAAGTWWWLYAFGFIALFQVFISILYPLVIAPLFNKFSPLPEGALKSRIESLSQRLGFRMKGIFIMDGSKRSKHSNAYFTGLGKAKRIVLFDTLIASMSIDQIAAVLAHEIGHEKKRHVMKSMAVSLVLMLAGLWILSLLIGYGPLYKAFGFQEPVFHGILVILMFCASPFTFLFTPLFSMWSRKHEYEADRFAVRAMGEGEALKTALISLGKDNLSNLTPHPLYSFYHYSHPTLAERIRAIDRYAAESLH